MQVRVVIGRWLRFLRLMNVYRDTQGDTLNWVACWKPFQSTYLYSVCTAYEIPLVTGEALFISMFVGHREVVVVELVPLPKLPIHRYHSNLWLSTMKRNI
jgi:hypothetical protein